MSGGRGPPKPPPGILIRVLRYLTAGESHGPALTVVVEGLPAGLPVTVEQIGDELARRRLGFGRGPRMRFERDDVELLGGVRHGRTLGSPVSIVIHNTEWPKWQEEMSPAPGRHREAAAPAPARPRRPRRHAEVRLRRRPQRARAGERTGDGRARRRRHAREAAARRARHRGDQPRHPDGRGARRRRCGARTPADLAAVDDSPVRCFDPAAEAAMIAEVEAAAKVGDSLGGVVEVLGYGVPPGPRIARALGPQDRRSARAGADEHPGDEGRRDRRRLRGRRQAGQRGPRRDPVGRRRRRVHRAARRAPAAPKAA